ncbi:type II toxin-antitoxin system HigB family toxin [Lichenicoccus roseus]|uniref:Type II toxin-antitoxin system HigB family toxin n=1 Tax=Lichenicoccus roseus TaxID=2683649 RepID=A0A5R9J0L1_9PROT|nr:type II toxin-antitoxin system HigB family toxin [Lichenicoccus roseus]TLU70469.1 type II toxin-antitoxin system HigB family toxin [Lichenicoccus roseus]
MQVIALRKLRAFWETHPQAAAPLRAWYTIASQAEWTTPADIGAVFNSADFVADNRVIFDIGGNKYRLIVHVAYGYRRVLIKFIGTHKDYDKINPEVV